MVDERPQIPTDAAFLKRLKKAHSECAGDFFELDGMTLHKGYAGYLIQYIELVRGE